ncbi:hypothetical protein EC973_005996 [Apophysomyces ossiformis]|uniref:Pyruvate carboxylase n=1 Tax=Apophysomyces ossiformis TaxID=679940 RepID=A0A8H7BNS0_9FUNG|nr:hypothetical protein EC973_005996 [Apophysomyces ossiformis]
MTRKFKLLVANRGEIAIRILTAAAELGLEPVAVYSDDKDRDHCGEYRSIKLRSSASFLDPRQVIEAAKSVQADGIHPGYGFLSESAEFAELCKQADLLFVGPSAECIRAVGDKVSARNVAVAADVPVLPATQDATEIHAFARQYGYPIMVKARDGGGGRGIRMIHNEDQIEDALNRCMSESTSKQVFIEKAVVGAKHVELQILGDRHGNIIHLFERDCSTQRRYQKVIETAPCLSLPSDLRSRIHAAAIRVANHIHYDSVGTVEFLVTENGEFYFLELNPRIQVEHTITEQITHVDLAQSQIRVALGESLVDLKLTNVPSPELVAIQARIVAENPRNNHMLSVGKIAVAEFPSGHGIRVDTWIRQGSVVQPSFDSLLAKVIVTARSFDLALAKLKLVLQRTMIVGVETNLDFLLAILSDHSFQSNHMQRIHIQWLEENTIRLLQSSVEFEQQRKTKRETAEIAPGQGTPRVLQLKPGDAFNVRLNDQQHVLQIDSISTNNFPDEFVARLKTDVATLETAVTRRSGTGSNRIRRKAAIGMPGEISSPVTGKIVEINVREGDIVQPGQQLFVVSAMKMETVVRTSIAGRINNIGVQTEDLVDAKDLVIEIVELRSNKL